MPSPFTCQKYCELQQELLLPPQTLDSCTRRSSFLLTINQTALLCFVSKYSQHELNCLVCLVTEQSKGYKEILFVKVSF